MPDHHGGDRFQIAEVAGGHRTWWQPHLERLPDVGDEAGRLDRVEHPELQQRGASGEVGCVLFTEQPNGNILGQDFQYVRVLVFSSTSNLSESRPFRWTRLYGPGSSGTRATGIACSVVHVAGCSNRGTAVAA